MNNLKTFINNFNFSNPQWTDLPSNFPDIPTTGLTRIEKHLFDAIVTAWIVKQPVSYFTGKFVSASITLTTLLIFSLEIISFAYWVNIEYNLGIRILTDFFA